MNRHVANSGFGRGRRSRSRSIRGAIVLTFVYLCTCAQLASAQVNVLTYHNDNARTGQNLAETVLTPATVNSTSFGKLFSYPVDGYVYAQPLHVSNVQIPGQGTHNVVYIATQHNSVYAFDADNSAIGQLWHVSFIDPANGVTTVPTVDVFTNDIVPEIGITSTPVIDVATGTLYVVAKTKETRQGSVHYVQRLHALDIATGAEKFDGPEVIADTIVTSGGEYVYVSGPTIPGTGDGSVVGQLSFNAFRQLNRPGLLLLNGVIYTAWGSHGDGFPYHGWLLGHDAQTLTLVSVLNTTPNGGLGGIWMGGGGPAADADGNIYLSTGNGTFNPTGLGSPAYGDSILKIAPGPALIADFFSPYNQQELANLDVDLGSGGVMVLPDQPGARPHLLVTAGKEKKGYLIDRDDLGGFRRCGSSCDDVVQVLPIGAIGGAVFSTPAYFNGRVYYQAAGCCEQDVLRAFAISGGQLSTVSQSSTGFGYPGATPSISANGSSGGIIWTLNSHAASASGPAVLYAHDAMNLANELYNSSVVPADQLGAAVKSTVPTIANGKIYVGTQSSVAVLGLLPSRPCAPGQYLAEYYSNKNLVGPATFTACESSINRNFGTGGPGSGVPEDGFSVRWTGSFNFPSGTTTFTATGDDGIRVFLDGEQIINGWVNQAPTTYQASRSLTQGTHAVKVEYYEASGGALAQFSWASSNNPVPTVTTLSPSSATAGDPALTLTVDGTSFVSGAVVQWNGAARPTTFVNNTRLTAAITAADLATAGTVPVTVMNPAPGGGTSNAVNFTIGAAAGLLQFSAATYSAGEASGSATITIMRTGGSVGAVDVTVATTTGTATAGADYTTLDAVVTFSDGDSVNKTVTIPILNDTLVEGNETVTVTLSSPTGGAALGSPSTAVLTITDDDTNPVPAVTALTPSSVTAGDPAFTLTVDGTSFVSGAVVRWNGATRPTTFVNSTQLTATITAADVATATTVPVTVVNPAPGGGASNAVNFTINPAPAGALQLSAATYSVAETGGSATITITRTGGSGGAVGVTVATSNGTATAGTDYTTVNQVVTFAAGDSANKTVTIPILNDTLVEGNETVTVTLSVPTGGASLGSPSTAVLTITDEDTNPVAAVTTLTPSSATAGDPEFTLTVRGSNFLTSSVVQWNGAARPTTFGNNTRLTATITTADLATAGTIPVTVLNPAPGGGVSNAVNFTIAAGPAGALQLSAATYSVAETGGSATITITRTGGSNGAVGVTVATTTGTATAGTDYTAVNEAVTFASGDTANKTVTIPIVNDTLVEGNETITVALSGPTGGATLGTPSTAVLTITDDDSNPAATVTTLAPSSATAGDPAFTLTVNGSSFVSGAVVQWNGAARTTTFVNTAQLTAAITAADLATAGTVPITVANPAPSGGISNAVNFTVTAAPAGALQLSAATYSVAESGGNATITITRTGGSGGAVSVTVATSNGTATAGTDYTTVNQVVTFAAGDNANKTVTIPILNDTLVEGSETVTVTLSSPTGGATLGSPNTAVLTITDEDTNPVAAVTSLTPSSATAGDPGFTLTVRGSNFVSSSVVQWNGAARPTTFANNTRLTATITAADLAAAGTVPVTVVNPAPGGGTSNAMSFTINAAPAGALQLSAATYSVAETGGSATITITRTGGSSGAVGVTVATTTGTATAGTDYTAINQAVTFATGDTASKTVTIPILNDAFVEGNETVTVTLSSPTGGAALGTPSTAVLTITDDDANPVATVTTLSPSSATAGDPAFTLTVNGNSFVSGAVVQWNGAARTTTFVSSTQLTAAITAADLANAGTIPVTVVNPAPGGGPSNAVNFAINAGPAGTLQLSAATYSVAESGGSATITITRTGGSGGAVGVTVATSNGTATAGTDYTTVSQAVTFVAGDSANKTVTIPILNDTTVEGSETVTVTLSSPTGGATLGSPSTAVLTITDDDSNPVPAVTTLTPSSATAGDPGFTLTVRGSNFVSSSVVQWNGAPRATTFANNGRLTAAITAADLATTGTVPVTVVNPAPGGGTSNAVNFTIGVAAGVLQLSASSYSVAESGGTATIIITRTGGSGGAVGVTVATSNGTATAGTDYTTVNQVVTFANGEINKTVTIPILSDTLVEGNETVTVTLSSPTGGAALGTPTTAVLTITDDDANPVATVTTLTPSSATAGDPALTLTVNGTSFVSGAVVQWNGTARTTTFVNSTQLTAAITAADLATAGIVPVTVVNPAPGGGPSNAVNFTINPAFTLTVSRSGNGTVTSTPVGIQCGSDCTQPYASGTTVTLTATPANNFTFVGWGGACTGTGACTVVMDAEKSITATFVRR
jgi:hypothetical protein